MRVKKTTTNDTTLYGWDNDRIFTEYDANGNPIQETVYFGSTPIALLKDGKTYRIFADQIDAPRVITDNSNTTLWAWYSKPFGESQPNKDVDGDNTQLSYNLRFPGQYFDSETGKHYNFNRDYDPVTGRYVQSDPIGLDGGINGYEYVQNSPLQNADKTGLYTIFIGGAADGQLTSIVESYAKRSDQQRTSVFFKHFASNSTIKSFVDSIKRGCPGEQIIMVGHSWGGDSAVKFLNAYPNSVNQLITVDPVGWFPPTKSRVPVNYWLDLDAKPNSKDASDYIAAIGYEWGQSVKTMKTP